MYGGSHALNSRLLGSVLAIYWHGNKLCGSFRPSDQLSQRQLAACASELNLSRLKETSRLNNNINTSPQVRDYILSAHLRINGSDQMTHMWSVMFFLFIFFSKSPSGQLFFLPASSVYFAFSSSHLDPRRGT